MPAVKHYFITGLLLATATFVLDRLTKAWALDIFAGRETAAIEVTPFFNLALVWNYGISFGMLADHQQPLLLTIASLIIVAILLIWLYKNTCRWTAWGLGLVIGGATGNIIDRLMFGAVVDFLDFHVAGYHWPAFNIADSGIFIGVVLLCVSSMFERQKNTEGNVA